MSYSTKEIYLHQAKALMFGKKIIEASNTGYFDTEVKDGYPWWFPRKVRKVELSDHFNPQLIFTLLNGDFIVME